MQSLARGDGANVLSCCYRGKTGAWDMNFTLECEQEVDGRWIAEVPELPGVSRMATLLQMQCQELRS